MSKLHTSLYALTTLASLAFAWLQPAVDHDPARDVHLVASAMLGDSSSGAAR